MNVLIFLLFFTMFLMFRNQWTYGVVIAYNHAVFLSRTEKLDLIRDTYANVNGDGDMKQANALVEKLLKEHTDGPSYDDYLGAYTNFFPILFQFWVFDVDKFVNNQELYAEVEPHFKQSLQERNPWTPGLRSPWNP